MKPLLSLLLQVILAYTLTLFFPWWIIVAVAFVVGIIIKMKGWQAFLTGFIAMSALWIGVAIFMDVQNGAILSQKVANLFQLPDSNYLIYITGFMGGLLGGMGCLTGQSFRNILFAEKKRYGSSRRKRFRHLKDD